jgi:hypothetical protein
MPGRRLLRKRQLIAAARRGNALQIPVKLLIYLVFGAGEGIRTLDPNLGKVVLYP